MPTFTRQTTLQDVADAYPGSIEGRTYVVTGATSGLGLTFSKFIASKGAGVVVITGRSPEKLEKTLEDVETTSSPKTIVKPLLLDLESEQSVRDAAEKITSGALGIPKIDILINNAGILAVPFKKVGGYESQFYCNHLSHFLFTNLIISNFASPTRIINISSLGHRHSPVRFSDINFNDGKDYDKFAAYGQSKTANILFSMALSKRLGGKGVQSYSLHPGLPEYRKILGYVTEDQGAATYLHAAVAPELNGRGGAYLEECKIANTAYAMTDKDADRLWKLSNEAFRTNF